MRTLKKEWAYINKTYHLKVEVTQKSIIGYDKKGYPIYKHIITPQVFRGCTKKECENKLAKYKYNDRYVMTHNIDKSIMRLI